MMIDFFYQKQPLCMIDGDMYIRALLSYKKGSNIVKHILTI